MDSAVKHDKNITSLELEFLLKILNYLEKKILELEIGEKYYGAQEKK